MSWYVNNLKKDKFNKSLHNLIIQIKIDEFAIYDS